MFLTFQVINMRRKRLVRIGLNNDFKLTTLARAHANFAEYVPFYFIVALLAEMQGFSHTLVHILSLIFTIGRIMHSLSLIYIEPKKNTVIFRVAGMLLTLTALVSVAVANIALFFIRNF